MRILIYNSDQLNVFNYDNVETFKKTIKNIENILSDKPDGAFIQLENEDDSFIFPKQYLENSLIKIEKIKYEQC